VSQFLSLLPKAKLSFYFFSYSNFNQRNKIKTIILGGKKLRCIFLQYRVPYYKKSTIFLVRGDIFSLENICFLCNSTINYKVIEQNVSLIFILFFMPEEVKCDINNCCRAYEPLIQSVIKKSFSLSW